jgi:hypothetical protein
MFAFSRYQRIEMDCAPLPAQPECIRQEFCTGKGQVHHDPVELPWQNAGEMARIREQGKHISGPVLCKVFQHQPNRLRVEIGSNHERCPGCERYRKRPDTSEHIEDDLPVLHHFKDTLSFG